MHRFGRRVEHELERVHAFYERHGKKAVFICRFIPVIRGIASLPAGISRMQKRYFVTYHTLGSAIFCFGLAYLGFSFGRHLDSITPVIHKWALAVVAAAIVLVAILLWARRRSGLQASL